MALQPRRIGQYKYNEPVIFQWPQQVNIRYSFIAATAPAVSTNNTESTNTEPWTHS